MTHPSREDWMAYLYGELARPRQAEAASHLKACPECQAAVAAWRGTINRLDEWTISQRPARINLSQPLVRWAAAALIMVSVAYGVGRLSASSRIDEKTLRSRIEQTLQSALEPRIKQRVREELTSELEAALATTRRQLTNDLMQFRKDTLALAANTGGASATQTQQLLATFEKKWADDYETLVTGLRQLDSQRIADYKTLRQELETVAVLTQDSLLHAQQQIVQLAGNTQTTGNLPDNRSE